MAGVGAADMGADPKDGAGVPLHAHTHFPLVCPNQQVSVRDLLVQQKDILPSHSCAEDWVIQNCFWVRLEEGFVLLGGPFISRKKWLVLQLRASARPGIDSFLGFGSERASWTPARHLATEWGTTHTQL